MVELGAAVSIQRKRRGVEGTVGRWRDKNVCMKTYFYS